MKSNRCTYSVDWLQIFCSNPSMNPPIWKENVSPISDRWGNHRTFKLVKAKQFVKGYQWQSTILYKDYTIAHVATVPIDSRVRKDGAAIKLDNTVLYIADWYQLLFEVLSTLGWSPLNITRVDLACDFNYFLDGLCPDTFIRKYVSKTKASYIRKGSNKFALYGIKQMHCTIYDSIRWGSRQSGVSVYMYNKSKELRDVKDKPWIRKLWASAGLATTRDVWRVEISITSQGLGLKSLSTHMFHSLFVDEFRDPDSVRDMWKVYAAKYFIFYRTDPKAKRKRDLTEVMLFDLKTKVDYYPVSLTESHDTGRMERIVSGKLDELREYILERDYNDKQEIISAFDNVISVYNSHHNIKRRYRRDTLSLVKDLSKQYVSALQLPDIEKRDAMIRNDRVMLQEVRNKATEIAEGLLSSKLMQIANASTPPEGRNENTHSTGEEK